MTRVLPAVVLVLVSIAPAYGQICTGNLPYDVAPRRIGGDVGFSANTLVLGGGYSRTFDRFFGTGGVFYQNVHDIGGAFGVVGSAGTERRVGADEKFALCPIGSLLLVWGPEPAIDTGLFTFGLDIGASVGFEAARRGTTVIVPKFGASLSMLRTKFGGNFDVSFTDTFLTLQAGVGFLLNDRMSVVPTIRIPVGADTGETLFSVLFTRTLGGS